MSLRRSAKHRPHRRRLRCEWLEDRRVLAVYTVDSIEDSGPGTLREAIGLANDRQGFDEIVFDSSVFSTPQTIVVERELPGITDSVSITGPGRDLLALQPPVESDQQPGVFSLIHIGGSTDSVLAGVTIRNFRETPVLVVGALTIEDSAFRNNGGGGFDQNAGVIRNLGTLAISRSHFTENTVEASGGAIYSTDSLSVSESLFDRNESSNGGAIYARGEEVTIDKSTFVGNSASDYGGAVYLGALSTGSELTSSTLAGNSAGSDGGAVAVREQLESSRHTIQNSTIVDSESTAIWSDVPSEPSLNNTIIAGTTSRWDEPVHDLQYRFGLSDVEISNSLIGYVDYRLDGGADLIDGENGNRVGVGGPLDPELFPLGYHGGLLPTLAPRPGSPVIDAGASSFAGEYDQRGSGYARVADGGSGVARIDIGAHEAQAAPRSAPGDFNADGRFDAADYAVWRDSEGTPVAPLATGDATGDGLVDEIDLALWRARYGDKYLLSLVVNSLGDDDDGDPDNGVTTLREAIELANADVVINKITFDPAFSGGVIEVQAGGFGSTGGYWVRDNLLIDASMLPDGLTIRGDRASFTIQGDSTQTSINLELKGLTIETEIASRIIYASWYGKVTLDDVEILTALGDDTIFNPGPIELINSTIGVVGEEGDAMSYLGTDAAVRSFTSLDMRGSEVANSSVGGVNVSPWPFGLTNRLPFLNMIDSMVTDSAGTGAIVAGDVYLERSHARHNRAGGLRTFRTELYPRDGVFDGGNVTLVDSSVSNNTAPEQSEVGSGIVAAGNVTLTRSRVENNIADLFSGSTGGGIRADGRVLLADSVVAGNSAKRGGGIYALGLDASGAPLSNEVVTVRLVGSSVRNNTSWIDGSGIQAAGLVRIEQSSISQNTVAASDLSGTFGTYVSAAVYLQPRFSGPAGRIELIDSVVGGNEANVLNDPRFGLRYAVYAHYLSDGVHVKGSQILDNAGTGVLATTVVDSVISRNAEYGVEAGTDQLSISGSTINANRVGVVGTDRGRVELVDSVVRGNRNDRPRFGGTRFPSGAGVVAESVRLERTTIAENVLDQSNPEVWSFIQGGGAGVAAIVVEANDSTIRDNQTLGANAVGGGIAAGSVTLHRTTVSGNTTEGLNAHGAGVFASGNLQLLQSTVSGNRTLGPESHGGGIYAGVLTAASSTTTGNAAVDGTSEGGGVYLTSSQLFYDTIIAGNTAAVGPDVRSDGVANQIIDHSLIGETSGFVVRNTIGALLDINPLLGPLTDNGGPTLTHALLPGSPAINTGDPERDAVPWDRNGWMFDGLTDQRGAGFPRVTDGGVAGVYRIDIGAVEFPGETAPVDPPPVDPPAMLAALTTPTPSAGFSLEGNTFVRPLDAALADPTLLLSPLGSTGDPAEEEIEIEPGRERSARDNEALLDALASPF